MAPNENNLHRYNLFVAQLRQQHHQPLDTTKSHKKLKLTLTQSYAQKVGGSKAMCNTPAPARPPPPAPPTTPPPPPPKDELDEGGIPWLPDMRNKCPICGRKYPCAKCFPPLSLE